MPAKGKSSLWRVWAHAWRAAADDSGIAAVEFAVIAPMFIALILVSVILGIVFTAKSGLDFTTQKVARMVMTGQVASHSALQTAICSNTGGLIDCNSVMASLTKYTSGNLDNINTSTPALTFNANGTVSNSWNTQSEPLVQFRSFNLCISILRSRGHFSISAIKRTARIC